MWVKYLALLAVIGPVRDVQPSLSGTDAIVPIGRIEFLDVEELTAEQFDAAKVSVFPSGYDVELRVMYERKAVDVFAPVILFRANESNALNQFDIQVAYVGDDGRVATLEHRVKTGKAPNPPPDPEDPTDPEIPTPDPEKITKVTYVYEKDQNAVPQGVAVALGKLNDQDILATEFEQDTVNGLGNVPAQYEAALREAKAKGVPCLVVQSGDKVLYTVLDPKTEEDVLQILEKQQ